MFVFLHIRVCTVEMFGVCIMLILRMCVCPCFCCLSVSVASVHMHTQAAAFVFIQVFVCMLTCKDLQYLDRNAKLCFLG